MKNLTIKKFDLSDDIEENLLNGSTDSISFTQELYESSKLQTIKNIHDLPKNDRILTRCQVKGRNIDQEKSFKDSQRNKDEIEKIEDRNDPPGKGSGTEDDENIDEKKSSINDKENQIPRKPNILLIFKHLKIKLKLVRNLLFLRKDNVAYFIDTNVKTVRLN